MRPQINDIFHEKVHELNESYLPIEMMELHSMCMGGFRQMFHVVLLENTRAADLK